MNTKLIENIKTRTMSNWWANGKAGRFEDFDNNNLLRFSETDEGCYYYLLSEEERRNTPVLAVGFVVWLISNWGKDTHTIFERYLELRLNQYKKQHINSPDALKRNLEQEFYDQYLDNEKKWIKQSEAIFEYITDDEVLLIKKFAENYLEYISQFNQKPYKRYNTFDQAINDCNLEDSILLHSFRKFCTPSNIEPIEMLNDILMIRNKHNDEPQKCFDFIRDKYSNTWKEYYVILFTLKNTLDKNSNLQLFIPDNIGNNHPLIGYKDCLENIRRHFYNTTDEQKAIPNESPLHHNSFKDYFINQDDEKIDSIISLIESELKASKSRALTLALYTVAMQKKGYIPTQLNQTKFHAAIKEIVGKNASTRSKFSEKFSEVNQNQYDKELEVYLKKMP